MAEYIEREAVQKAFRLTCKNPDKRYQKGMQDAIDCLVPEVLAGIPSTDVQPVKRGHWIKQPEKFQIYEDVINSNYLYSCSCCNASDLHSERANNDGEVKFCWRCGARMDGDSNG